MTRTDKLALSIGLAGGAIAALAIVRRWAASGGREVPGGVVMDDAAAYDTMSRLLLGSLFSGVAADIASHGPPGDDVLEVGCGPGHLSLRLARDHHLHVTGLDLDPRMIGRARANAERAIADGAARPAFLAGDVAALPFADASFDLVVSTMSMHHWEDPAAGLGEIGRVLRRGGRALIWDLGPGGLPFHRHVPDALADAADTRLEMVSATDWQWPWRFSFSRRTEFRRAN
jgi:ubiquinone/menaquinone biosynthesis C-methylase UbiE